MRERKRERVEYERSEISLREYRHLTTKFNKDIPKNQDPIPLTHLILPNLNGLSLHSEQKVKYSNVFIFKYDQDLAHGVYIIIILST